jgi:hypothetical protein
MVQHITLLYGHTMVLPDNKIYHRSLMEVCLNVLFYLLLSTSLFSMFYKGHFHDSSPSNVQSMSFQGLCEFFLCYPYHILYQPSTNIIPRAKALGMILVSRVDTGCDSERAI